MIIKDEETLERALQMISAEGAVRYSDEHAYVIITTPETLELQARKALARNSIAVIAPRGQEHEMEDYSTHVRIVRRERIEEEKKDIKRWFREHPEDVEQLERKG